MGRVLTGEHFKNPHLLQQVFAFATYYISFNLGPTPKLVAVALTKGNKNLYNVAININDL